jgi:Holliday junction resolvase
MSEKALWKMMTKKGIQGYRLEGCNMKGVPDTVVYQYGQSAFIELKDWSNKGKKHPLTREQLNFLHDVGGYVLVKTDKKTVKLFRPSPALCTCDPSGPGIEICLLYTSQIPPHALLYSKAT